MSEVNGIWYHSSQGQQYIKLAMGEEALSANCTVRTTKGVHYIKLDRWGDSRHRTTSYKKNNKLGGRKTKFDIQRYWNEKAQKAAAARMASIPRNPSPPPNWRAEVLRPKIIPRPTYKPQTEDVSDDEYDYKRNWNVPEDKQFRRTPRKYPVRAFRPMPPAQKRTVNEGSKRHRTPSPEASRKRIVGQMYKEVLERKVGKDKTPLNTVNVNDSDTDSVPTGEDTPNTVRMTGDSPQSPPNPQEQEDTLEEKITRRNEEMEENALRRGVLPRNLCKERVELEKLIEEADKKNEELDKELQELDDRDKDKQVLCGEQLRTKQWIEDVRKAMRKGAPIPGKLEEIDIAYPSLEIRKKTPEEAPNEKDSNKQPPTPGTCGPDPLEEEVPAYKMPPENKDPDSVPLEEAVAQLCGPKEDERPPVPLEPEVEINNMPAPAATLSKDRDIEADKVGRDVDQGDGGDSDCQIVDENPPETPRPKTSRPTPQGLWRLKKAKDTSVTLQLVPHKEGEKSDVPPTPGPSPPGTMKKWPTQDLSKFVVEKEKPTSSKEYVDVPTSSQEEKQEKQD